MTKKEAIQDMLGGEVLQHTHYTYSLLKFDVSKGFIDENNTKIDVNNIDFNDYILYQEPPKTESWAKFRGTNLNGEWVEVTRMFKTLQDFKLSYNRFYNHHEIEGSRIDLPVVED